MFPRLAWLALGTFAIGTESFVVAPLLPAIAGDLGVPIATTGWLVTVFALFYAFGAPVLAVALANVDRKRLVLGILGVFAVGNLFAAAAQSLALLIVARALLALAAGLYLPTANAVAAALVPAERRGRAIAIVIGGSAAATALGVPIGSWLGAATGWRTTFFLVAAVAALAAIGQAIGLPRDLPRSVSTLGERLAVARRPEILHALAVTLLFATGLAAVFTYLAPLLTRAAGFGAGAISATLFLWGAAAAAGNALGGAGADRLGPDRMVRLGLLALAVVFAAIGIAGSSLPVAWAAPVLVIAVGLWGLFGWAVFSAQMTHLAHLAPEVAVVSLSLNASTFYAGIAAGSALGTLAVSFGLLGELGFIAATGQLAAFAVLVFGRRTQLADAAEPA